MVFNFPGFYLPRRKVYQLSLLEKLCYLHTYCCCFMKREKHVTCPFDPMAANPEKQTAVGLHYLTGRYVFYVNIYSHGDNIHSLYRFTKYSPVIDHPRCEEFVFAYRRRSLN